MTSRRQSPSEKPARLRYDFDIADDGVICASVHREGLEGMAGQIAFDLVAGLRNIEQALADAPSLLHQNIWMASASMLAR